MLGDFGADVIKIEMPGVGDISRHWETIANGLCGYFVALNRNKRSLEIDIKSSDGMRVLLELIRNADVFIQNYRPDVIKRLKLTYEDLKLVNPKIIYCGISGFGRDGPYRNEPAYDLLIQAESGLASLTGTEQTPSKIGISVCDLTTGLYSALAISMAFIKRQNTGEGSNIELSMFETALSFLLAYPMYAWYKNQRPKRRGMKHSLISPSGAYLTADEKYVVLTAQQEKEWARFCEHVINRPDLFADKRFSSNEERVKNRDELEDIVARVIRTNTQVYWLSKLKAEGIPSGRLNDMSDVITHPQVISRGLVSEIMTEVGPIKFFGNPIRIQDAALSLKPVPSLGKDNASILNEISVVKEKKSG